VACQHVSIALALYVRCRYKVLLTPFTIHSLPCDISSAFGGSFPALERVAFDCVLLSLLKALDHAPNFESTKMGCIRLSDVPHDKWIGRLIELTLDGNFFLDSTS
jgi:hypothetical protein